MKHEERSKECSRKIAFKSIMLAVAETKFVGSDMDENIESFVEQMKLSGLSVSGWMDGWVDSIHRSIDGSVDYLMNGGRLSLMMDEYASYRSSCCTHTSSSSISIASPRNAFVQSAGQRPRAV